MSQTQNHLFCFGLGFSARTIAKRLQAKGWRITGTTRTPEKKHALAEQGFDHVVIFDRDRCLDDASQTLHDVTHVLISAGPDAEGDSVINQHAADIAAMPGLKWLGYLSTTGVYGNHDGAWVDEDAPLSPSSPRSEYRVAAERAWLDLYAEQALPVHLFRLAGIYGPGRSLLDTVKAGKAKRIDRPGQVFSRIHVEDIASVLEASIARPNPGRIYNVCDDKAASPAEVTAHACALLGVEPPPLVPFEEAGLSPMGRTFWLDNKRVSNRRLHEELGVELRYPDYKAGLASLL
ncbi:SDR family oxidoreductase [Denitrobaculum tricleocarpae]|uniref:SDR family oxidoreductase n=1 Tax=Denitrobaculum tricleocarpae TaxID=2591009 RepID=A0A545U159_9PROT|nr:SDR family oxidoreductase [Denitrobaculum tricleocarpae]TQV83210.1 SDR family oxidoreductase [Denitrobaculum tricleocarpae]